MIVDVEATTAIRQAEVTAQHRMIDRTQERLGLWPERLVGDTGYGDAKNLSLLAAPAQNLRKMAKLIPMPATPAPA